jgi:transmembrane sensor
VIREVLTLEELERLGPSEAAALLLVRQDAGGDEPDEGVFDAWLSAHPAHAEAWARACAAWAKFDDPRELVGYNDIRDAAVIRPARRQRLGIALAASLALAVGTGGALLLNRSGDQGPAPPGGPIASIEPVRTLATAKGERKTFALADASTVTLNTDSAVAVAYRPVGERRLELIRGQAFFNVAHDKARPFVVAFRGRTVTALGTAFEVRGVGDAMRVILVEGRVSVRRAGGAPVVMHPGQQLLDDARRVTLSSIEIAEAAEWRRGLVTFRDTTLKEAVAEFNRYADRRLVITDPRVAQLTVSGVFRTDDSARFARTVAAVLPVRVVPSKGEALELVPSQGSAPADSRR